ncbi:hypothetical protein [Fictibacillus sp. KU28468]|uniref:hypothetical protein n=1 Tax=Fictibacillus sp. KU28468 TaxID=2991053 RepID=UPI00223E24CF|nr:hypothetical protein [Fictibacillus sp. KU28468]UZJ78603.1 hypothetical protein OKX00_21200 [Fictibacillus sp. KU28468]
MKLKTRNFPHPVIHPLTDDIVQSHFTGNIIGYEEVNHSLNFSLEFKIKNDTLNTLFEQDYVHINVHFECSSTMQRLSYKISRSACSILQNNDETICNVQLSIDSGLLNKKVDVNYFILANCTLPDYTNSNMHPDFQDTAFNIEKGDILALAITQTIYLEKDELVTTNSIFRVAKDPSASASPISIAMNNSQIEIIIPKSIHEKIGNLKEYGNDINMVLISMLYYPALLDVLHNIHLLSSNDSNSSELDTFESLDWFRTLEKKIRTLGQDITNLNPENIPSLAYAILYESKDKPWAALEAIIYREDSDDNE